MTQEKKCFKCGNVKPLTDFYKHKEMPDGHVNKCKECNKNDVRENYKKKSSNEEWLEKERIRGREKYHRLNYKESQKEWDKNKPWKKSNIYKNLRSKFKEVPITHHLHHWNYNDEFLTDIIVIEKFNHRRAHNFLILDIEKRIYKDLDGNYLTTKESHINYLSSKGIII